MFRRKPKQKKAKKPNKAPGKKQPNYFAGKGSEKDLLAPSSAAEVKPGEESLEGKANNYWVEIGSTIEPVRYFRSFFASLTGNATWAGMLDQLFQGDFGEADVDTVIHIKPADSTRILWQIERKIAGIEADIATEKTSSKRAAMMNELRDLQARQARLRTSGEKAFFVSLQAVVSSTNKDKFRRFCNALVKRFAGINVILRGADTRQLDALMYATPVDKKPLKDIFFNLESSNLADFFPFGLGTISHQSGINLGTDPQGRPILLDSWHPSLKNYNMVVTGEAGSGKSVATKKIIGWSVVMGIKIAVTDPEKEYKRIIEALGCPYFSLSANSKHGLNIFDVEIDIDDDTEEEFINVDESVAAVKAVVFHMIRQIDDAILTGIVKVKIDEHIRELYKEREITGDPESLYKRSSDGGFKIQRERKEMPTLSDLHSLMEKDDELDKAARILKSFTKKSGSKAQAIFDGQSTITGVFDYPIIGFSTNNFDEVMKPIATKIVNKWVWERFGKRDRKQKKRIIIDESQLQMDDKDGAEWMENAYRRARKLNISMLSATQGFEVYTRVEQGLGVLKNCPTKLILRQEAIDIDAIKEQFALSEGEAQFLLMAPTGQGILRVDNESTLLSIDLTDYEYQLFTTNPNDPDVAAS